MNLLQELRSRFADALSGLVDDPTTFARMVFPAQNPQFGDYQANCAMSLGKQLGQPPRTVANTLLERLQVDDLCESVEIAGPGFLNLRVKTDWLAQKLTHALPHERLDVELIKNPKKIILDYSSPNVAKPMHVGHLRSTVIGDALYRILNFLGHDVVSDNHIGDWGTQFGMILYGYKNFLNRAAYQENPVGELSRLYRLVNQLCDYHDTLEKLPGLEWRLADAEQAVNDGEAEVEQLDKESKRNFKKLQSDLASVREAVQAARRKLAVVDEEAELKALADAHPEIIVNSRLETAKLHDGDGENCRLWDEFLPACNAAMQTLYDRLDIRFDMTLGESYYQPYLAEVVDELEHKKLAQASQGAMCVFIPGNRAPFIVQKQDGAFTYATTDLATIRHRVSELNAEIILYVVDKRQSEHFQLLFETARLWGYDQVEFQHISFGTVMGKDNKPFKTRSGDIVGLGSLLDEAVTRARAIVDANDDSKPQGAELNEQERQQIAQIVGLGGIKYADLHHNRESDYVFDWDKMLSMTGDTATYMQYAYARVCGIFRKANFDREVIRQDSSQTLQLSHPAERALGLQLFRFQEILENVAAEYRPHLLTGYLFETANAFSSFYEHCPVVKEEVEEVRMSRLKLCELTARTLQLGLQLLGIETSERM